MSQRAPHDPEFWAHCWWREGPPASLHRIVVGRGIAWGQTPLAAQLHAIADVVACADPAERGAVQAMGPRRGGRAVSDRANRRAAAQRTRRPRRTTPRVPGARLVGRLGVSASSSGSPAAAVSQGRSLRSGDP